VFEDIGVVAGMESVAIAEHQSVPVNYVPQW